MRNHDEPKDTTPIFRDDDEAEGEDRPDADILPEGAARGGITVPDANDTGITTPPISGWGETPAEEDERAADR